MVYLIICMTFTITLVAPVSAEENLACCQQTNSGETCRYTLADECDSTYQVGAFQFCEDSNFCKPGCCISPEGSCSKQVGRATCEAAGEGWRWTDSANCELEQCQKSCCVLAESECTFTTEKRCASITSQFEGLSLDFRNSNSEAECTAICKLSDQGCCAKNDGSCVWESRAACGLSDGTGSNGFYKDAYCSHESLQEICIPECSPKAYKGCIEGEEEVFWFDSCGNPEGIAEDCDYAAGTLCSEDKPEAYCKSVNCETTQGYEHLEYQSAGQDNFRWNGESWCYYDTKWGAALDAVGSRHFMHMCINGEEIVEPCKDFREEICLQAIVPDMPGGYEKYRAARCIENEWEVCTEKCNSAKEIDKKDDDEKQRAYRIDQQCCEDFDCTWFPLTQEEEKYDGLCVPKSPPGGKFWSDDSGEVSDEIESQCNLVDTKEDCNTKWQEAIAGADMKCIENCECYTNDFLNMKNKECNAMGDCGAYYNYKGNWNNEALYRDWTKDPKLEEGKKPLREVPKNWINFNDLLQVPIEYQPSISWSALLPLKEELSIVFSGDTRWYHAIPTGIIIATTIASTVAIVGGSGTAFSAVVLGAGNALSGGLSSAATAVGSLLAIAFLGIGLHTGNRDMIYNAMITGYVTVGVFAVIYGLYAIAGATASIPVAGWIAAAVALIVAAIATALLYLADSEQRLVTIDCQPWTPPSGGDNCELCDEDLLHPCSEYRCKSLGKACQFIAENEGSDRETCYAAETNDIIAPIITPWLDGNAPLAVLERINSQKVNNNQEYPIEKTKEESITGYAISKEVPAFSTVSIGIKTNELAQCKYTTEFDSELTFSKLPHYFGDNYYKKEHNLTIYGLTPEITFEFYIICRDANNNPKEDQLKPPYKIRFTTDNSPDLTAPYIVRANPGNNGFVSATTSQIFAEILVDEPNMKEDMCRFSNQDMDYELMSNTMACSKAEPNSLHELYNICYPNITINDGTNTFYIRCKDEKDNYNEEPYVYKITKSQPLTITSISPPAGTEYYTVNATLQLQTAGGAYTGVSTCSFFENSRAFSDHFYITNSTYHEQKFSNLLKGFYDFTISCFDSVGNEVLGQTNFSIAADLEAPNLVAIYKDGSGLHITLNEQATCEYSENSFSYGTGTLTGTNSLTHNLPIGLSEYHLICKDQYSNTMPEITIITDISII
ncbi:MAG: hypothetical protein KJ939_04790 [Nanoarchaeota archaeon]|nr:hypothetical protein [Nanoarchaeota archaeon]MBU4352370.1 hypothetical protein [Nanoarchaeota archaeon]MCG2719337.1 hypothetical protein [Nanoarchaeota archaeon]